MPRPITDTLRQLRGGAFMDEAGEKLTQALDAVLTTGKAGKLTIELTLSRVNRGAGAVVIRDRIVVKMPDTEVCETMLFATPDGTSTTDPRQQKLELRQVPEPTASQPKVVEASNG